MKNLIIEAITRTKALVMAISQLFTTAIYLIVNAYILNWISLTIENPDSAMKYEWYIIIGCVVCTVISGVNEILKCHKHLIFTYLNDKLTDKLSIPDIRLFGKFSPGEIMSAVFKANIISGIPEIVINTITQIATILTNAIAVWLIMPEVLIPVAIAYAIAGVTLRHISNKWNEMDAIFDTIKNLRNVEIDEIVNGYADARSYPHTMENHLNKIHKYNETLAKTVFKRQVYSFINSILVKVMDAVAMMSVIVHVVYLLMTKTSMIGESTALAVVMYVWRMAAPFAHLAINTSQYSEVKSAFPKVEAIMEFKNGIQDGYIIKDEFTDSIVFNNVSFSYDGVKNVLQNITFSIKRGEHVGICGDTGDGKSTLLNLLIRFHDVTSGEIRIDGIDIKKLKLSSLHKIIGIVHQKCHIFDNTVYENVAYGRTDEVEFREVEEACKKACIHDTIVRLTNRYNTKVGPRGYRFSGGENQRISLARLFLMDPDIVLLDEGTSALDNKTEKRVQANLDAMEGKTIIAVAHRLSTIRHYDKIVVIENGSILDIGTHEELMSRCQKYQELNQ